MNAATQVAIAAAADAPIDRIDALADQIRFLAEEAFPINSEVPEAASRLEDLSDAIFGAFDEDGVLAFGIAAAFAAPGAIAEGEAAVENWERAAAEADGDRREEAAVR